jgi:hypothetical protein
MRDDGRLEGPGWVLFPGMTRSQLEASVPDAGLVSELREFASYAVAGAPIYGRTFDMLVTFRRDTIYLVSLTGCGVAESGWNLTDELVEHEQRENDRWLRAQVGQPGRLAWGAIEGGVDPKTGVPGIAINYQPDRDR